MGSVNGLRVTLAVYYIWTAITLSTRNSAWGVPQSILWKHHGCNMMMSSDRNIFHVTGLLCGVNHRWIPREGKWRGPLVFSLICAWTNGWVNNREVGDLRRHRVHYDVTLMMTLSWETREYGGCIIANCSDKSLAASQITGKTRLFVNQLTRLAPK